MSTMKITEQVTIEATPVLIAEVDRRLGRTATDDEVKEFILQALRRTMSGTQDER